MDSVFRFFADATFWIFILTLIVLFVGDPDLHDILIERLSADTTK